MAGLLAYEGDIPDSIRRAAQFELDVKKAQGKKLPLSLEGSGLPESVRKAAQGVVDAKKAQGKKIPLSLEGSDLPDSVRKAAQFELDAKKAQGKKIPLSLEGSGLPESVRKAAQSVVDGESRYNTPRDIAKSLATPKGAGKLLGGLGTLFSVGELAASAYDTFGPPAVSRIKQNLENADLENFEATPEQLESAGESMEGIANRAVQSAKKYKDEAPAKYMEYAAQGKYPLNLLSNAPEAPQGQAPNAPEVSQEVETKRQAVEQSAEEQLRTNQLSRPKAAEAVVGADISRSGEELTPDQKKARVAEEATAMKRMDNKELARYLSYALAGVGLAATAIDKSGDAGKAFARSFENQAARSQDHFMAGQAAQARAQQQAIENEQADRKIGLQGRGILNQERDVESKIGNRDARLGLSREELDVKRNRYSVLSRQADEKNSLYAARTQVQKDKAGSTKTPQGSPISQKDNVALVDSYFKSKDVKLGKGVKEALAADLRQLQKNNPTGSTTQYLQYLESKYKSTPAKPSTGSFLGFSWGGSDASLDFPDQ